MVGAVICLGLTPTIGAMMWIGATVAVTMGEDIALLRLFARHTRGVPAADLLQGCVASLLLTPSYAAVLEFIQFSLILCAFRTVLGLIKLRITRPDLPRPYRAWGYPVTPMIFLGVTLFMLADLVAVWPIQSLGGSGTCSSAQPYSPSAVLVVRGDHRPDDGADSVTRSTSRRYSAVRDCLRTRAKPFAPAMKLSAASSPDSG